MKAALAFVMLVGACASPAPTSSAPPPAPPPRPAAVDAASTPVVAAPPDAAPIAGATPDAGPRPKTCAADVNHCCEPDGTIHPVSCSPSPQDDRAVQRTRGEGGWCDGCYKKCLPATARVATPLGAIEVAALRPGDLVWTLDGAGDRVAVPIVDVRSIDAPSDHQVLRVTLSDGRIVAGSAGHPTADGRSLGTLGIGEPLDGAEIIAITAVPLGGDATWDLLPGGATGVYWADGVLLGSTLFGQP